MKSGTQLSEAISINTYGDIPLRQVRIYSCVDAIGTVGIRTPKYKWTRLRCRELEGRLGKQGKDKKRLVAVIKEVTLDRLLFSAFPPAHWRCSLNLCAFLTGTVRLNDPWDLHSHGWAQILSDVLTLNSVQSAEWPINHACLTAVCVLDAERPIQMAKWTPVKRQTWVHFIFGRWIPRSHGPIWRMTIL